MKSLILTRKWQAITAILLCTFLVFGISGTALAVELFPDGTLPAGQTVDDDVLITGDSVVIDGTVNGNLLAFGRTVTINGDVSGDVIAMGSLIIVNGQVGGNVFSVAHTIQVNGDVSGSLFGGSASLVLGPESNVGGNAYYGGFSLEAKKGSVIQRDLALGGYQALLKGAIGRDARISSGALELDGAVGRDLILQVESPGASTYTPYTFMPQQPGMPPLPDAVPSGLRIGPEARIEGKLVYTSGTKQDSAIQATPMGGVVYQTPTPQEKHEAEQAPKQIPFYKTGFFVWLFKLLREFIALMVFGSLAAWLIYPQFKQTAEQIASKPLPSLGVGFVVLIVGYAAFFFAVGILLVLVILFAIITLGSISGTLFGVGFSALALAFAIFNFLVTFGSKLVVALYIGQQLLKSSSSVSSGNKFGTIALGIVLYSVAHAIPFIGWLVAFVATLIGLGATWFTYLDYRKQVIPVKASEIPPETQLP